MRVPSLGWEDPLEEAMATHSRVLAWRVSQTEEPGGLQSTGLKESDTTEATGHERRSDWAGTQPRRELESRMSCDVAKKPKKPREIQEQRQTVPRSKSRL